MKTLKMLVGTLALVACVANAAATTLFNENFDNNPPYNPLPNPQPISTVAGPGFIHNGEWAYQGGTANVVTTAPFSNPNCMQLESGGVMAYFGLNNTSTTTTTNAMDVHFAVYKPTSANAAALFRVEDSAGNYLGEVDIDYGLVGIQLFTGAGGGSFVSIISSVTPGTWYNVDILMPANPSAVNNQYTVNVSDNLGNLLGSATGQFETPTTTNNYGQMQLYSTSTTIPTYFDNILVTAAAPVWPLTLIHEDFEEANLGGTCLNGVNTTGISPTVGTVTPFPSDYGIIVPGLNGSTKCLQAQDQVANGELRLLFNPVADPTTGIVNLSFNFVATGAMSGSGPLQLIVRDGTAQA